MFLGFSLPEHVVDHDIGGKGDDCDAETGEHAVEHGPIGEDWVFPPRVALGPRITEKAGTGRGG